MSFMRGIVENTLRNMSPEERRDALLSVVGEVVRTMTPDERAATLVEIVRLLSNGTPVNLTQALADTAGDN